MRFVSYDWNHIVYGATIFMELREYGFAACQYAFTNSAVYTAKSSNSV